MNLFDFIADPDPLFLEVDPRIRIHIKMKRIWNTDSYHQFRWIIATTKFWSSTTTIKGDKYFFSNQQILRNSQ